MNFRALLQHSSVGALVGLGVLCVPVELLAQEPPGDPGRRMMSRFGQSPSDRDIEDASAFMQQNAPNRWQLIQSLPDEGAFRRGVMAFMVARYKSLQGMRTEDPSLYEIKLNQLKSEDDIYGYIASSHTVESREKLRPQLEAAVKKMIDLNIAEREHRIAKLRTSLAAEEQRLENDRKQVDRAVATRVDTLIADGPSALRRELMPLGRAGGRRDAAATRPVPPRGEALPAAR